MSMRWRALLSATVLIVSTLGATAAIEPQVETVPASGTLVSARFVTHRGETVAVETVSFPRQRVSLRILDYPQGGPLRATVLAAVQSDVVAAINGGYFTGNYQPDGLLEIGSIVHVPARAGLSGIVGADANGAPVVIPAASADTTTLRDAVQSGPFLVDPGGRHGIRRDDGQRAMRSFVILNENRIGLGVSSRCGLYDLATALVESPQIFGFNHIERALNLDGGPSTGFAVRRSDGRIESIIAESTRLRTVVAIVQRSASPVPSAEPNPP